MHWVLLVAQQLLGATARPPFSSTNSRLLKDRHHTRHLQALEWHLKRLIFLAISTAVALLSSSMWCNTMQTICLWKYVLAGLIIPWSHGWRVKIGKNSSQIFLSATSVVTWAVQLSTSVNIFFLSWPNFQSQSFSYSPNRYLIIQADALAAKRTGGCLTFLKHCKFWLFQMMKKVLFLTSHGTDYQNSNSL